MRSEGLGCVDIRDLFDWDWTGIIEMLQELAGGGDLPDLYDNVHIIMLGTGHVEADFGVPSYFSWFVEVKGEILMAVSLLAVNVSVVRTYR